MAAGPRTQKELAELLGVSQSQVADWEHDRYSVLSLQSLIKLATVFHCSVDELLAGLDPDYDRAREGVAAGAVATESDIPVVGEGDARPGGIGRNDSRRRSDRRVLGWLPRPAGLGDPRAYGVEIRGDAMIPAYRPKMIALASPALQVRDGDDVYAYLADGECLVRSARTVSGGCVLQPYNTGCRARFVKRKEIEALHVIVYSHRRGFER